MVGVSWGIWAPSRRTATVLFPILVFHTLVSDSLSKFGLVLIGTGSLLSPKISDPKTRRVFTLTFDDLCD